jgi:hypothetical protein
MAGQKRILDIGCGKNKKQGADGMDVVPLDTVDIVHDLNIFPYPIDDNYYDEIYCIHVLEHVSDLVGVMKEIYRIGRNGCNVYIKSPHCSCNRVIWIDPTHRRGLSISMFQDYFSRNSQAFYYAQVDFEVKSIRLNWMMSSGRKLPPLLGLSNRFINWLANLNRRSLFLCERVWSYWVGGFEEVEVHLKVVKGTNTDLLQRRTNGP